VRPQSVSNFDDGEEDVAGRDSRGRLIVPSFPAKKQSVDEDGSSVKDAVSTFVPTHTMKKNAQKILESASRSDISKNANARERLSGELEHGSKRVVEDCVAQVQLRLDDGKTCAG
jgi:hypothetical protein